MVGVSSSSGQKVANARGSSLRHAYKREGGRYQCIFYLLRPTQHFNTRYGLDGTAVHKCIMSVFFICVLYCNFAWRGRLTLIYSCQKCNLLLKRTNQKRETKGKEMVDQQ
jgi:hypothetical protein